MSSNRSVDEEKTPAPVLANAQATAQPDGASDSNVDQAWKFLNEHRDAAGADGVVDMKRLRRKIDLRVVPLMFLCYTMQFLDKVILNYAAVMGINEDLGLVGNQFSNIATFLFVGLLCFEVPNSESLPLSLPSPLPPPLGPSRKRRC